MIVNLRLAAPAIFIASLLLLPFLNKPFTIDDPLFLREAQHALIDPAHPSDFEQVWNAGDRQRMSQYLLGGTLPAYLLVPVALLGAREWVAHLYQWLFFCVFVLACVSVSRRLGCDQRQANIVALLVATNPVTLAMSATCMPDVMAAAFGVLGIDRVLAFREERRWHAGLLAALFLAAAMLCRANAVPLVVVAGALLIPAAWKHAAASLWPVALAILVAAVVLSLNRGGAANASAGAAFRSLTSIGNEPRNAISFLAFQALTGPILLYSILTRGRRAALGVAVAIAAGLALSHLPAENLRQYAVPAALALCFLAAFRDMARQLRHAWPLMVWLFAGLITLPYVYTSAKYVLPGVPAAALLIVLHAARVRHPRYPLTIAILIAGGWIAGALVIIGDTTLAGSQRAVAESEVPRLLRSGGNVWAGGQWAFLEYAQRAGALPLGNQPPWPEPNDFVVVSRLDYYGKLNELPLNRDYLYSRTDRRCGVFVMNRALHAGFFSNRFGYLPFAIGCAELNRYDVYRVLP
jgi:hypothetical protein